MLEPTLTSVRLDSHLADMTQLIIPEANSHCKLTTVPTEIISNILQNVTSKRDILNVMVTCKFLSRAAERLLWKVSNNKGYEKLLQMEASTQATFAAYIHQQTFTMGDNSIQPAKLTIDLPQLEELIITHRSPSTRNTCLRVSRLITARLVTLEVSDGTTDNFIPALSRARGLKHLTIGARVDINDGKSAEILHLVATTPSLETLRVGHLSTSELFKEIASHKALRDFAMTADLNSDVVAQALQTPQAFSALRRLSLVMSSSGASELLPRLSGLTALSLTINQDLLLGETLESAAFSVFRSVGTMTNLKGLRLIMQNFNVLPEHRMFQPLANLTSLEKVTIIHDFRPNPSWRNVGDLFPLSRSCPLEHLYLDTKQRVSSRWIASLARRYPGLKTLSLGVSVNMIPLKAHFPALKSLSLIRPALSCRCMDVRNSHIRKWATEMLAVAPRLEKFEINLYTSTSRDIIISYEHNEHEIICTARSHRDGDMTFSLPGPLIQY